ncbi:hypothetical protein GlitD10_1086 [Gloeomargarita lithophora Alchichica-D10]|uniref:Dual OB-containing domain-containing protein n=1 Tax=Gloeomargarita lithophora Alchichica-D10 TaxID=1188229 RepID=A0A1J0ABU6_9CYAN|nr:hypothetical protein [Gloeomargarita lithophora]APB33406.1 hypothetical protein GlitD10_1086 [Gloeomargarita lithophora Alchichica-D10]
MPFSYLSKIKPARTLQLIEVKQLRWERNQYGKCKAFILDDIYNCADLGFSITDPAITAKINPDQEVSSHCLLCMSLAQPWQGGNDPEPMCYRLVAGVIELLPEITLIGQEMQRVGWTITQGRHYLQNQFSKQSRYQLMARKPKHLCNFSKVYPPLSRSTV